jgi:hypothetical protein
MSEYRGDEVEWVSRSAPENVRRLAYREALLDGCPWRSLPLDGLLVMYGGASAADLGEHWLGKIDMHVCVENELLRRMFSRLTGTDSAGTRVS